MKKFAILLLLVLVLALGLTACGQAAATTRVVRWDKNEHYRFNITKADLPRNVDKMPEYSREYMVNGEVHPEDMDEKVPVNIIGTYDMDIKVGDNNLCTFTTEMTLYSLYETAYYNALPDDIKAALAAANQVLDEAAMKQIFGADAQGVALLSTTKSFVIFNNNEAQRPVRSQQEVVGYYLGDKHQEVNSQKIAVEYNWEESTVSVKTNDGEPVEKDLKYSSSRALIDVSQILLYVRSLNKTSTSFQDSPSVQVYDPVYDVVRTATFSMTYLVKTYIYTSKPVNEGETPAAPADYKAQLTCVAVAVDGQMLMMQMNLPASINDNSSRLDTVLREPDHYNKYTTVRFRTGYMSFELNDYYGLVNYNGEAVGEQILKALIVDEPSK